jgi:hypothetical protein
MLFSNRQKIAKSIYLEKFIGWELLIFEKNRKFLYFVCICNFSVGSATGLLFYTHSELFAIIVRYYVVGQENKIRKKVTVKIH